MTSQHGSGFAFITSSRIGLLALPFVLALTAMPAGCGTDGGASAETSAFLGTWSCANTQIETCPNGSHSDDFIYTCNMIEGEGGSSILTIPSLITDTTTGGWFPGSGSPLNWVVSGNRATIEGAETQPTGPGSVGGTWTPTFTAGTMTLVGNTLSGTDSGSAIYINGYSETCGFYQTFSCTAL
jgi:hypothetical protein